MSLQSHGLLMYRRTGPDLEVLLVHPGGPFWAKKDAGAWSIPKGLGDEGEDNLAAAIREFTEETGLTPTGPFLDLGQTRLKSGKVIQAWAFEGDCELGSIQSNTFEMEWPIRSGKFCQFPEVDRAEFFRLEIAREKFNPAQAVFLDRLVERLSNATN